MKYIHKDIYTILLILIVFSLKIYSEKTTIQILMKQSEVPKNIDTKNFEENYNAVINSFLLEEYKNNTTINDIEVSFTFYKDNSEGTNNNGGSTYLNFIKDNIQAWTESKYDMAILDDRYLFNEESLIESIDIKEYFYTGMPTVNHFLNLSLYIDNKDIEHHSSDSLYHSHFKDDLYALPYEKDFDLLYFNSENGKSINITSPRRTPKITMIDFIMMINLKTYSIHLEILSFPILLKI
ncbi:hypothetical protein LY90DRAFT_499394 [Neocallimastix californiae]|uniref:Uncharacterized protein n=1 Tax=Neocallimastix californiae TaxID=1754190 RepID=A0A1Y2FL96_9FUNG|nr:hypothetical protein LY90DRAFT_499394 [Neocallimastix californiae]|eukprot:ORY83966.1 hypothetical protein LY90DRAFT_499394 [Neocallimastix californiae]